MTPDTLESKSMGRVTTEATIENLKDLWDVERGIIPASQARRVTVPDAVVDTCVKMLSLPKHLIKQLGLGKTVRKRSSKGVIESYMYEPVRLTIQGRDCTMDVLEVPDNVPVLIGQMPQAHLDFVVDPCSRTLIGNPAHGGEHMYEMY